MSSLLQPNLYLKAYGLKKILFSSGEYFFGVISHPESISEGVCHISISFPANFVIRNLTDNIEC